MIKAIFNKEIKQFKRDGRAVPLLCIIVLLGLISALHSWTMVNNLEKERISAIEMDKTTWVNQGNKNAHTAAHFSRYAFQPVSGLAIFDPGITDYIGRAIWMEAHYQDPAKLRPVEDKVELQRFVQMSPAWLIQYFVPLLTIILIYASVAGERESGTLRQIMSSGASPLAVFLGKVMAVSAFIGLLIPVLAFAVWASTGEDHISKLPDTGARLTTILVMYVMYLFIFVFIGLTISSSAARSKTALIALIGFWIISTVIAPRFSAEFGSSLSPSPAPKAFAERLKKEAADAFWSSDEKAMAMRDKIKNDVLAQYKVKKVADLPINYDGYLLQESEEYANEVFDRLYAELWQTVEMQHAYAKLISVVSPTIAMQNISRALAGTDIYSHRHFTQEVESFRREFVRLLNEEMINHGGKDGYGYQSGNQFWQSNPDFEYTPPLFSSVFQTILTDIMILLIWFVLGSVFALNQIRKAFVKESVR